VNESPFTIALLQSACIPDPAHNLQTTLSQIRAAAAQGAQVICTQELFRTQYVCQSEDPANFDLAEPIPGPTTAILSDLARELHVALVASLFERRAPGLYHNTAAVIDADGALLGTYRKMHIPDDPLFYEKYYFTPGDAPPDGGFRAFQTKFGRIGVLICWDQWFPEAARLTALQGCSVLFYPTAIAWHPREQATLGPAQLDAWITIQRAHAIASGIYVASANRTGLETIPLSPQDSGLRTPSDGLQFWGNSFIADPFGRLLQQAPANEPAILLATIDPQVIEQTRRLWPFLRDRRLDAYAPLTTRFGE
jgi:N-carbamoylputrescine amidase